MAMMPPESSRRDRCLALLLCLLTASLLACESRAPSPLPAAGRSAAPASTKGEAVRADCVGCHARDYREVREPVHEGVRPDRCAACHLETAWSPAALRHRWPLTGAHATTRCFACHLGTPAVFEQTPDACVGCHRADYDKSLYPGHDKFALTCADCHTTTAFRPALQRTQPVQSGTTTENAPSRRTGPVHHHALGSDGHAPRLPATAPAGQAAASAADPPLRAEHVHPESLFPIATGAHAGIGCQTCHDQGGVMGKSDTDCVQCHKRSRFDPKHQGVSNYPRGAAPPNFCVECHTRGRARF